MAGMRQAFHAITVPTRGKGLYALTSQVRDWVRASGIRQGLLTLYIRHTSASLLIQESHDPAVQTDLERFLSRLVPEGDPIYEHTLEGADDMPAHVRAARRKPIWRFRSRTARRCSAPGRGFMYSSTGAPRRCALWCCTCWASRAAVAYSGHSFSESRFASL